MEFFEFTNFNSYKYKNQKRTSVLHEVRNTMMLTIRRVPAGDEHHYSFFMRSRNSLSPFFLGSSRR